jgi:hypothetical protein
MKKKIEYSALLLFVISTFAYGGFLADAIGLAAQAKPPAYTLKDATAGEQLHAEWVVKVRSLDALRASINAVLVKMDWKVLYARPGRPPMLPAYSFAAVRYPSSDPDKRQGLFIDMDMDGANVTITADWYLVAGPSRPKAEAKQFYDEFFRRLAEALK